jgi:hypothetical protein
VAQENHEVIGLLMRKEEHKVLADITITPQEIPIREHTTTQVHPLPGSIRGLEWMSYEEK